MTSKRSLISLGLPKDVYIVLTRHGYETLQDLEAASIDALTRDLNMSSSQVQALLTRYQSTQVPSATPSTTQSAAVMVQHSQRMSTRCLALDTILGGGLMRGHILEISGPPGSPKEGLMTNIVSSFVEAGDEVVFVDCEHMSSPHMLSRALKDVKLQQHIRYIRVQSLPELLLMLHHLPGIHAKVSLLVINSISFPFQAAHLGIAQRNAHLDRVKQCFSKVCASHNLTIVTTSQLATKMINEDGTPGTFDSGARGIMLPQLGAGYLPNGRAFRVIASPDDLLSGHIKLLSSPKQPIEKPHSPHLIAEPYILHSISTDCRK